MIIGLTGPAGAGKNEVAKILKHHGVKIIDADEIGHSLLEHDSALARDLVSIYGAKIVNKAGGIDRQQLGKIVFNDLVKLKELNHILHPVMKMAIEKEIKDERLVAINAAVLSDMDLVPLCDEVWVVMASVKNRLERLTKQRKISKAYAQKIINAQRPKEEYLQIANQVINNDGTLEALKKQVEALLPR